MDKLIKFFPFMPKKGETGKLILAILFYLLGVGIAAAILEVVFSFVPILGWILLALCPVCSFAYTVAGVVFAIMSFTGYDFNKQSEEAEVVVEATAEGASEGEDA